MSHCYVVAARRTAVAPAGGRLAGTEAYELGAAVIRGLLTDLHLAGDSVDLVIGGNALYGGGNPTRMAALAASLPHSVPAMTLDTQCAGGLDAVSLGQAMIASGQARVVIAGGLESWSLAPARQRVPRHSAEEPEFYSRPPFSPFAEDDPELAEAAYRIAERRSQTRAQQNAYVCESHRKALDARARLADEITPVAGLGEDSYARRLQLATCARAPTLAGVGEFAVSTATTAVSADAAAFVVLMSAEALAQSTARLRPVQIRGTAQAGVTGWDTPLSPVAAGEKLFQQLGIQPEQIAVAEIMEAYAAQAQACIDLLGLDANCVNRGGGALARGHPIGASGAINLVRLFHELQSEPAGALGLASIAAAGGLGSALLGEVQ